MRQRFSISEITTQQGEDFTFIQKENRLNIKHTLGAVSDLQLHRVTSYCWFLFQRVYSRNEGDYNEAMKGKTILLHSVGILLTT